MKKLITLSLLALYVCAEAQLPVSHDPENKKAILEEFTGKTCTFCPAGHKIANDMKEADPDNVFLLNIHTGSYASGTPNYRTAFGPALASQSQLGGYPAGTVNRHYFGYSQNGAPAGATGLGRGQWSGAASSIKGDAAYVNVALEANVNLLTREMTVNVEAYYTGNSPASSNFLTVAITQDGIKGPQVGASSFYPEMIDENGDYTHNHMLRHFITGQWGAEITTTSTGSLFQDSYSYTLPDSIGDVGVDMTKLHVIAFVTENHQEIINGNGTEPSLSGLTNNLEAEMLEIEVPKISCTASFNPIMKVRNWGNTEITSMKINYAADDLPAQTYDWTGSLLSGLSLNLELPTLLYNSADSNNITIEIVEVNGGNDDILTNNKLESYVFPAPEYKTNTMQLVFTGDQYSGGGQPESSWLLYKLNGDTLQEAALGTLAEQAYDITLNLPDYDCYVFEFKDAYGDGLTGSGPGTVSVDFNGTNVLSGSGSFSVLKAEFATVDDNGEGNGNPDDQVNGIRTLDNVTLFEVYPNPTIDLLNVNVKTKTNKSMTIQLVDLLGRIIAETNSKNGFATFNTSKLNRGLFFVNVVSEGKSIATSSVVVK